MDLPLDARIFVHAPFRACPRCGLNQFGVFQVAAEMYTRRCQACRFRGSFPLPRLSRKVVYVDQFAISNMMKTLNARSPGHKAAKADPFWLKLFEALERVVKFQLVVCPESDVHHQESMVFGCYEQLKRMYEQFSRGVTFDSTDAIALRQLNNALLAWLEKRIPEHTFDPADVVRGNLDQWREPFIVSVSGAYPPLIINAVREFRDDVHQKVRVLFDQELRTTPAADFKYWFARERRAGGRGIVQSYYLYLQRNHEIATGAVPFTYENVYQSSGLDQFNLITEVLKARGIPEERLMATLVAFLQSDEFKDYPASRISSLVWAAIGRAAAGGQKEPPNAGTSNDIRLLTLAPYCDALFVDNGCRALWEKIPSPYRAPYKVRLFSYNTRDQFLSYLQDIEDHGDPSVVAAAREVYGEPRPFVTMYEYEERRRQQEATEGVEEG